MRFRLLDMDAPERTEPGYREATERLAGLTPPGTLLNVQARELDSFGRTLCNLTFADGTPVRP